MPSGNSAAARVLQTLSQITGETKWKEVLEKQSDYLAGAIEQYPSGHSYGLLTMMNILYPTKELLCTISDGYDQNKRKELLEQLSYLSETVPNLTITVKTGANANELGKLAPYTREYPIPEADILFYLCTANNCMPPVSDLKPLLRELEVSL